MNQGYMSAKSVQEFFDISHSEFYRLKKEGKLPKEHYPIKPTQPRYLKSEIMELNLTEKKSA